MTAYDSASSVCHIVSRGQVLLTLISSLQPTEYALFFVLTGKKNKKNLFFYSSPFVNKQSLSLV